MAGCCWRDRPTGTYQIWSIDTDRGTRRLELETSLCGESEGLDTIHTLGGRLHWLIAPFDPGCELTYGPSGALLHFARRPDRERFQVTVPAVAEAALPGSFQVTVSVTRGGRPVRGARVSFAGYRGRTSRNGLATISGRLELPGRFAALARKGRRYGLSPLAEVGRTPAPARAARNGAG